MEQPAGRPVLLRLHQRSSCRRALPLHDRAIIRKLAQVYDLDPAEQQAVQDLVFQPRAMLARFALLFDGLRRGAAEADRGTGRATSASRTSAASSCSAATAACVIARHLTRHVAAATGQQEPDDAAAARLILRSLAADENAAATSWETDSGALPALTWTPPPNGSALAALLGLTGTGLLGGISDPGRRDGMARRLGIARALRPRARPRELPGADRPARFDTALTPQQLRLRQRAQRLADERRDRRVARRRPGLLRHLVRRAAGRAGRNLRVLGGRAGARTTIAPIPTRPSTGSGA